jgi:hypothetical protein
MRVLIGSQIPMRGPDWLTDSNEGPLIGSEIQKSVLIGPQIPMRVLIGAQIPEGVLISPLIPARCPDWSTGVPGAVPQQRGRGMPESVHPHAQLLLLPYRDQQEPADHRY